MPELIATLTPNSYPHDDGRVEHGYQLTVLDQDLTIVVTVDLPDWESFSSESANQCISAAGFSLQPDSDSAGWSPAGLGHMASVVRA